MSEGTLQEKPAKSEAIRGECGNSRAPCTSNTSVPFYMDASSRPAFDLKPESR